MRVVSAAKKHQNPDGQVGINELRKLSNTACVCLCMCVFVRVCVCACVCLYMCVVVNKPVLQPFETKMASSHNNYLGCTFRSQLQHLQSHMQGEQTLHFRWLTNLLLCATAEVNTGVWVFHSTCLLDWV